MNPRFPEPWRETTGVWMGGGDHTSVLGVDGNGSGGVVGPTTKPASKCLVVVLGVAGQGGVGSIRRR